MTKAGKQALRSKYVGKEMLTDAVIDALTLWFGQNIRKHDSTADVATERTSIMSTFSHSSSIDANPKHFSCRCGADLWCWVRRA
jgi:hypothetical protein